MNSRNQKLLASTLSKVKWDIQQFNARPIFLGTCAVLSGFNLPWKLFYRHFLYISKGNNVKWYYDIEDYKRIGEIFWDKIKTPEELSVLIETFRSDYRIAKNLYKFEPNDLKNLSLKELIKVAKKQVRFLKESVSISHVIESAGYVIDLELKEKYGNELPVINASNYSFLKQAELYAEGLFTSEKDEKNILKKFREKFGWVQNSYMGSYRIKISDIKGLISKEKDKQENIQSNLKGKLLILSHLLSWQDERKANILQTIPFLEKVFMTLAKKVKIPPKDIMYVVSEKELEKISNPKFKKELLERKKYLVDYSVKSRPKVLYSGKSAEEFIEHFESDKSETNTAIIGRVAFKGVVTGIVRVCSDLISIKSFKEGEVLVTSMTRPEFIGAMKKAIAFVTDEGGITSHAAIISRELKKPCIIGTKIATEVLQDGDLVEVNAERGVVTILKKNDDK